MSGEEKSHEPGFRIFDGEPCLLVPHGSMHYIIC